MLSAASVAAAGKVVEAAAGDREVKAALADCFVCSTSIVMDSYQRKRSMARSLYMSNWTLTKVGRLMPRN